MNKNYELMIKLCKNSLMVVIDFKIIFIYEIMVMIILMLLLEIKDLFWVIIVGLFFSI